MIFAHPWILVALALLPILWWLLRATPPAARAQNFPAIRLLAGLKPREETPARTPWWLLALRLAAAALIIVGLAGPILGGAGHGIAGAGPLLLVIDNGWSAAPDWPARLEAANTILDQADRQNRRVSLLATASSLGAMHAAAPQFAALLRPALAALTPSPWPVDRAAASLAVAELPAGPTAYIADGTASAQADADARFAQALARRGAVTEYRGVLPARLLTAESNAAGLTATIRQTSVPIPRAEQILAETGDGRVLARTALSVPAGATTASVGIDLPVELRNQLAALRIAASPGAGSVALLDEASRRRPVGLLAGGTGEAPLLGTDFYLERALAPFAELRRGSLDTLLARPLSVLIAADQDLAGPDAARIEQWVRQGGFLIRFAGPHLVSAGARSDTAGGGDDAADRLLPENLLQNDRQLGGAMSWSQPQHLAAFPAGPFAGLAVPDEVTVTRQVLAEPTASLPGATWAELADGTPLVTAAPRGNGMVVLFHVTANADWSNLPLSGLFPDMLRRLVQRASGVASMTEAGKLVPAQALDGAGVLGPPPTGAMPMTQAAMAAEPVSPRHPPGFYGTAQDRHAFNVGGHTALAEMTPVQGATRLTLASAPRALRLGPDAIALALALLLADMLLTLRLRGLLRPAVAGLALLLALQAHAQGPAQGWGQGPAQGSGSITAQNAALSTHLAYVVTGNAALDGTSKSGLGGLSDYVNDHTAAVLAAPVGVSPGRDDLSFYPLIYWPIDADAQVSPGFTASLNDYMRHGGIVVIDTRSGGQGEGSAGAFAPGADAALRRVSAGLDVPALAPLTNAHVLSHAFYLLSDFPGRYEGATVWVQRDQDRSNDSVSPVIIGANDWAAAWALDEDGRPLFATIPGGQRQRTLAWRFGVNLVMYALTGNYKGDQVHVPAILQRLGQ
jgi:hypothetical protein